MKKYKILALMLCAFLCLPVYAAAEVSSKEYSPDNYINISGAYTSNGQLSLVGDDTPTIETDSYKISIPANGTIFISVQETEEGSQLSPAFKISVVDSEGNECLSSNSFDNNENGFAVCAYTTSAAGNYFVNISADMEKPVPIQYSVSISELDLGVVDVSENVANISGVALPSLREDCTAYALGLNVQDLLSVKCGGNAYILYNGSSSYDCSISSAYDDFNGYIGAAESDSTAYIFVFGDKEETVIDLLPRNKFVLEDMDLPINGILNLDDASIPYPEEELAMFTSDFGENIIDNSPVKYFRFRLSRNQILRITTDKATSDRLGFVCEKGDLYTESQNMLDSIYSFASRDDIGEKVRSCYIVKESGTLLVSVRSNNEISPSLSVEVFESFSTDYEFKKQYNTGNAISGISLKNIYADFSVLPSGNHNMPGISCYKLINSKGDASYFTPENDILLNTAGDYSLFAVLTHGDNEYQVFLADFKVNERIIDPNNQQNEPSAPITGGSLPWWAITLISVAGFCLACVIFLLVYKEKPQDKK